MSKKRRRKKKEKIDLRIYKTLSDAEDYNKRFAEQNGKCALCHRIPKGMRRLNRDHNHTTLKPRGLLCFPCNKFCIGALEKFKISIADLIKYFKKYDPTNKLVEGYE